MFYIIYLVRTTHSYTTNLDTFIEKEMLYDLLIKD